MRTVVTRSGWALALLLTASTAWAQPAARPAADEGGVHRMVIYNGPVRTVHYVYANVSPSEETSLRELQRAEDQVSLADALQQLKLQYIRNDRDLETRRHEVQRLLYGYTSETSAVAYSAATAFPGYPAVGGFHPGYGYGAFGYGPYAGGLTASAGVTGSASNSLMWGVGDEGVLKTELAKVIAREAGPDYAAHAGANLSAAMSRASEHERTRTAMGLKEPISRVEFSPESRFGVKRDDSVTVTMRMGDKTEQVKGTVTGEDAEWLRLRTDAGEETIRTSEIMRVAKAKK